MPHRCLLPSVIGVDGTLTRYCVKLPIAHGDKVILRKLFVNKRELFEELRCPGDTSRKVLVYTRDLIWRAAGNVVRFVLVIHPHCGNTIYMTTDLTMTPSQILEVYSLRFRIEQSFRQAIHTIGTYAYHFWMLQMAPIARGSGNQYLHRKSQEYRVAVFRKIGAYHHYLQVGIIAQGILQYISTVAPDLVWASFRSWIRTIRPGVAPSEMVTATALRNAFPEFLRSSGPHSIFTKFIISRTDPSVTNHLQHAA